jgi:hypothetical protein
MARRSTLLSVSLPQVHAGAAGAAGRRVNHRRLGVDLAGALPLLVIGLAAFAVVEGNRSARWLVPLLGGLRLAPDPADLALGALMGLGAVLFGASAGLSVKRRARPWPLLLLPAVALGAAYFGAYWTLHEAVVLPGASVSERLGVRGPAIFVAQEISASGFALASLLLSGAAVVFGLVARTRTRDHRAGGRRIVALFLGLFALGAAPALMRALDVGHLGYRPRTELLLAAIPSALGVLAVFLGAASLPRCHPSRRRVVTGDILVAAACSILAVLLLGLARGLAHQNFLGDPMPAEIWPFIASSMRTEGGEFVRAAALFVVPVILATAAVIPPSIFFAGLARRGRSLATVVFIGGVPVALLRALTLDAAADVENAWRRQVPAGFTLPEVASGVPLCEELVADKVLFIGFSKITLGGRDLGPTSQLDSDAGAGAVMIELDRAVKADEPLRIAVDASLPYGPIDRLARLLLSAELPGGKDAAHRAHRRPRCQVEWVARRHGAEGALFPACASLALAGDRCPDRSTSPRGLIVVSSTEVSAQIPGREASFARGPLASLLAALAEGNSVPGALSALDRQDALVAAGPDVPAGSVIAVAASFGFDARGAGAGAPQRGLLPSSPLAGDPLAAEPRPAPSALERLELGLNAQTWSGAATDTVRSLVEAQSEAIRACELGASGSAESRSGISRFHLLIGRDGAVRSLFRLGAEPGGARVTACVKAALFALRFAPGQEIVATVSLASSVKRARLVVGLETDDTDYAPASIEEASRAIKAAEPGLLLCYENELERSPGQQEMIEIPLELDATKTVRQSFAAAPAVPPNPELVACLLDGFKFLTLPEPPKVGALRITLGLLPP